MFGNGEDHWEEFSAENHVRTGGRASGVSFENKENPKSPYPLTEPSKGNTILVRTGLNKGRAIGIVYTNDYADKGLTDENAIHVLWLNKSSSRLEGTTERTGFSILHGDSATYKAFADTDAYRSVFKLIQHVGGKGIDKKNQHITEETAIEKEELKDNQQIKDSPPLNQILYGPPGTGKTWNTVNHALAIIDGKPVSAYKNENRDSIKQRFDELKESGKIDMVTFHQNFAYEDFIEGIRPVLDDGSDDSNNVHYEIVAGIFKRISNLAKENLDKSKKETEPFDLEALLHDFAQHINQKLNRVRQ